MNQENLDKNEEIITEMEPRFEALKPGEVASFSQDFRDREELFNLPLTFQSQEVEKQIIKYLIYSFRHYKEFRTNLFREWCKGEVLRFGGKGWEKGKVRIKINVEFCPDEPEEEIEETESENSGNNNSEYLEPEVSPLDDLRQKFNQENE